MGANTLQAFSLELSKLLAPVQSGFSNPQEARALVEILGWLLPPGVDDLQLATVDAENFIAKLKAVIESTPEDKEDELLMATRYAELLVAVGELIQSIRAVMQAFSSLPGVLPGYLAATQIHEKFFTRLFDYLLISYFEHNFYWFYSTMRLAGIFEQEPKEEQTDIFQSAHIRHTIYYDRIGRYFSDPKGVFAEVYGWGGAEFNAEKLLYNFALFFQSFGGECRMGKLGRRAEEQLLARVVPEADTDPMSMMSVSLLRGLVWDELDAGLNLVGLRASAADAADGGLGLIPYIKGSPEIVFELMENLFLEIEATLDVQGGVALFLRPGQGLQVKAGLLGEGQGSAVASGSLMFKVRLGNDGQDPIGLLVIPGGSGLYAQKIYLQAGAGVSDSRDLDLRMEAGLTGGKIVLTAGEGDGFLQKVLPKDPMEIDFDIIFGISSQKGFYIKGGAGLAYTFNINKQIGPILIGALELGFKVQSSDLKLTAGLTGGLQLGPLTAMVQNMGMALALSFGESGNLGKADLSVGFKPPDGIGLSIDAKGIKGAGFLSFDFDNQQYAGGLELSFQNSFNLSAVGILNTKMPDGSKGFSLLIIITAEFPSPLALGMNFYLAGVGGLLGLNRTVQVDVLRAGVKAKTLDNILFPKDIVKNMNSIISDLRSVFPPAQDQFLIGPMALITWGAPALVKAELGLIIEFVNPVRLAILGVLRCMVPTEDAALIKIQVNFLGIIDFEAGYLSFDASIFDSYIGYGSLKFSLAGDLAIRISWGEKKDFLLSVGGFHPAYQPPAYLNVPKMTRLTISLLKDNPRLVLTTYFAVTSNTVQFGAEIDFYFAIASFKVIGYFGFDVLFQFSPFKFMAEIRAGLAVKLGSATILGIDLRFALEGPTPWHAKGSGSFSILFFSFTVGFDKTFGDRKELPMPTIEVLPLVVEALEKPANWQGLLPDRAFLLVSLNALEKEPDAILLHSHGILTVHQNILPFGLEISQFGNNLPQDIKEITVEEVLIGGESVFFEPAQDMFAPAVYQKMSDSDRLKAPSYVAMESGVKVAGTDELHADYCSKRAVEYEFILSDYEKTAEDDARFCRPIRLGRHQDRKTWFEPYIRGGMIGSSPLSGKLRQKQERLDGKKIAVGEEEYIVVEKATLNPYVGEHGIISGNREAALKELKSILQSQPGKADSLQVVPAYQAAEG